MKNDVFELESDKPENIGKYAKRQYFGVDAQFSVFTPAGQTVLRAEYLAGKHAGTAFNLTAVPTTPCYMRNISGGYALFAQDFGTAPLTAIFKYDWYNPNTDVSGNKIAEAGSGTGAADIQMTSVAVGLLWRIAPQLRLTAYYDMVSHEKTKNIENVKTTEDTKEWISSYGYAEKRPMDVFTLRLQYSF